jgi:hypothetical protein
LEFFQENIQLLAPLIILQVILFIAGLVDLVRRDSQLVEVAVFGRKFYLIFNRPAFCLVLRRDAGIDCYSVHYHITSI